MITAQSVIDAARGFIGTPFVHQGRLPGVGLDCAGLIECAVEIAGGDPIDYPMTYPSVPTPKLVIGILESVFVPGDLAPAAVLLLARRSRPRLSIHIALMSERDTIIHAEARPGKSRVLEHASTGWMIARSYRIPGVEYG